MKPKGTSRSSITTADAKASTSEDGINSINGIWVLYYIFGVLIGFFIGLMWGKLG